MEPQKSKKILALFDVDGTLTKSRNVIQQDMIDTLELLKNICTVGVVGGSDKVKVFEQLTHDYANTLEWVFTENGTMAFKFGELYKRQSIKDQLGEEKLQKFINFCLKYEIDIPIKRGTFIEYRNGMLNVSPIGRNCSQEERDEFEKYDNDLNIRKNFIEALITNFGDYGLKFSIGGQISFDVFPQGWDKTYCLRFLTEFDEIHFFGDKTYDGGNDYEIFISERTIGHTVTNPADTIKQLNDLFLQKK